MSKLIQIRNVPPDVHRTLKVRAARAEKSLSDYIRGELEDLARRPTPEEMRARLRSRQAVEAGEPSDEVVRAIRGERDDL